jgi:recombination protein RecT
LRAATLRLSVDASTGQAYLVPFNNRATLIVGYKGLHDMAVRTNRYRYINVAKVYEGQVVTEDWKTGWHKIDGRAISADAKIIGWIGAFEMVNGYAYTLYMTIDEIHEHAKKYSKGYDNPNGTWKKETNKMERKTVLRLLLRRWGFLDPADVQQLNNIEEDEVIDGELKLDNSIIEAAEKEDKPKRTEAQNLRDLGYEVKNPDPVKEGHWNDWLALCEKADALKIEHPNPVKDSVTDDDLAMGYAELLEYVQAAEYQAKAVE